VPSDERCKARGRWYDQLTRKTAEPQHEAWARARCAIKAADCAHDDAGPLSRSLDRDVGRSIAQVGDEVHALIGHRNVEPVRRAPHQGSQFTSFAFTNTLKDADIRISMDGRGRWMDNVFIERLWRSLKYECVYLNAFETGSEAKTGIGRWIGYYNADRPHSVFGGRTPDEVYATQANEEKLAA
jgi:transposase InsO family protein